MLRFGFMDIPEDPCLLVWGDRDDLLGLARLLRRVPSLSSESSLAWFGCHSQTGETVLLVQCESGARGLMRGGAGGSTFRWELDSALAAAFADKVQALAGSDQGHHYLETDGVAQTTVRVSIGEYPDDFLIERPSEV